MLCWGRNVEGQLGDGTASSFARTMATPVRGLAEAAEITAGPFHTCARRADGQVLCWGFNDEGQLGDGSTERRLVPTPVVGL